MGTVDTETLTPTDFLLARIAEDEEQANWDAQFVPTEKSAGRVLAECEAKRRIMEMVRTFQVALDEKRRPAGEAWMLEANVLPILAAIYADHPDYRDEWRP